MIKGAIFDMDGTLLDSMAGWETLGYDYIRMLGIKPTPELANRLAKMTLRQATAWLRSDFGVSESVADRAEAEVNDIVYRRYMVEYPLKPGAKEILERLHAEGVRMCVATSTAHRLACGALERCGVLDLFTGVFSSDIVGTGKTTPRLYNIALESLGTPKGSTMVFEDVIFALRVAKNDGFLTAAVYDSNEKDQESMMSEADIYIRDLSETDKYWSRLSAF